MLGCFSDSAANASWRNRCKCRGSSIEAVGHVEPERYRERIDADGLVLAPGFIDAHIHTDATLLREPVHLASVHQGVTTHIVGQDGFGFAPTTEDTFDFMASYTAGINGRDVRGGPHGIAEYLGRFDEASCVNVATLIPNGCVRMEVVGSGAKRLHPPYYFYDCHECTNPNPRRMGEA